MCEYPLGPGAQRCAGVQAGRDRVFVAVGWPAEKMDADRVDCPENGSREAGPGGRPEIWLRRGGRRMAVHRGLLCLCWKLVGSGSGIGSAIGQACHSPHKKKTGMYFVSEHARFCVEAEPTIAKEFWGFSFSLACLN